MVPLPRIVMVQTQSNSIVGGDSPPYSIVAHLAAIVAKLEVIDTVKEDVVAVKQPANYHQITWLRSVLN